MKKMEIISKKETELKTLLSEKMEIKRSCIFQLHPDEKNTKLHKNTCKDIARIKTVLREKE